MRNDLYKLEDLITKWRKEASGGGTSVDLAILKELDRYQRVLPNLKHVRGDGWEDKHWRQLFALVGLQTKGARAVDSTTLTLGHFLSVSGRR